MADEMTPATTDADTLKGHYLTALRGGASLAELERREFVATIAQAGAPMLRRSSAERNSIRQRIARRFYTKGA